MGGSQSVKNTLKCRVSWQMYVYDEYVWIVSNIPKLLSHGVGYNTCTNLQTSTSKGEVETFKVLLYPNGFNERVNGHVSVFLQKLSSKERRVSFTCSIIDANGQEDLIKYIEQIMGIESYLGWINFCPRNILMEDELWVLKNGNLTLKLKMANYNEIAQYNPLIESEASDNTILQELSDNSMSLFQSEDFHDFTIHVQGSRLPAHKAILSARSPVLKAMLKSQFSNLTSITITDISEPIVKLLLVFIYSGKVGYLDFYEAGELYYAADKYEIHSLKDICCSIIKDSIKVDNVIHALIISERHSDVDLQEICLKYVVKNASQFQNLVEWMEILKSQPRLANIVFKRLASNIDF